LGDAAATAQAWQAFAKQVFTNSSFAMQGNQESRLRITALRSLHAGKVPNGVRWKNLLRRHYRVRCLPEFLADSGAGEGI
jgi:hypothetical protein